VHSTISIITVFFVITLVIYLTSCILAIKHNFQHLATDLTDQTNNVLQYVQWYIDQNLPNFKTQKIALQKEVDKLQNQIGVLKKKLAEIQHHNITSNTKVIDGSNSDRLEQN
jgi:peptidoglycan hydrolase CwlO-like protein